jgi:hypothetical protein
VRIACLVVRRGNRKWLQSQIGFETTFRSLASDSDAATECCTSSLVVFSALLKRWKKPSKSVGSQFSPVWTLGRVSQLATPSLDRCGFSLCPRERAITNTKRPAPTGHRRSFGVTAYATPSTTANVQATRTFPHRRLLRLQSVSQKPERVR